MDIQYTSAMETSINFAIGDVMIKYLAKCEWIDTNATCAGYISSPPSLTVNVDELDSGVLIFVVCLLLLGAIILVLASYTSKNKWKSSDPVKFDYIIFFIIFLWTSVSQFAFVLYLFGQYQQYPSAQTLGAIFYTCLILFILSYIANIIALTHYLQIWNHALAPGVTRHWFVLYKITKKYILNPL